MVRVGDAGFRSGPAADIGTDGGGLEFLQGRGLRAATLVYAGSRDRTSSGCGLVSLTLLTLLVVPAAYVIWRSFELRRLKVPTPVTA